MKKISYIAAILVLAACGGKTKEAKLEPEVKLALSAFESEAKALSMNLEEARAKYKQYAGEMHNLDSVVKAQVPSGLPAAKRTQVDEQVKACGERKQQLTPLNSSLENMIQEYSQASKAYGEWTSQIKKGELDGEEINSGLDTYRGKLNDLKNRTFTLSDSISAIRLGFGKHLDSVQKLGGFKLK